MTQIIPTKSSIEAAEKRLVHLKQNLIDEQKSDKPSQAYINDLKDTIDYYEAVVKQK